MSPILATLPILLSAALILAGPATPATAQAGSPAGQEKTRGELIEACLQDVRKGLRPGQKQTPHQRMQTEEQCRAHAEATMHTQSTKPKR